MLCTLARVYHVPYQDSLYGSSRTIQVKTCFGDNKAGGFVELLLKSCLPRKCTAWVFFPQNKIICQMLLQLFSITHPFRPSFRREYPEEIQVHTALYQKESFQVATTEPQPRGWSYNQGECCQQTRTLAFLQEVFHSRHKQFDQGR